MLPRGWAAGICAAMVLAPGCSRAPLPDGYESIHIGMTAEELRAQRPNLVDDRPGRLFDPHGPAAYRIIDGRVAGLRILVRPPESDALLVRYSEKLASDAVPDAPYTFQIDGHLLRLFSVREGVEILYGVDPGAAAQREEASSRGRALPQAPKLELPRTSRPPVPPVLPMGESSSGVDVWLLRLSATSTGAVTLRLLLGVGSAGEAPGGLGATAVAAELVRDRVAAEAEASLVDLSSLTLRGATMFTLRGLATEVARVGEKLAAQISAVGNTQVTASAFDRAYGASLRQSVGTSFERRLLEDEGVAAAFPGSAWVSPPVDLSRPPPETTEVAARAKALASAPLAIIAAGSLKREEARAIARAAGTREPDARAPLPKPALPNRESRAVPDPALAIDGLWVETRTAEDVAKLMLAEALLAAHARRKLRLQDGLTEAPLAVIGGGTAAGSYLMMVCAAKSDAAEALEVSARATLSTLASEVPRGASFRDARDGAHAALARRLATPDDAVELMTDLALLRGRPEWIRDVLERLARIEEPQARAYLEEIAKPERTFSVRWSKEG